MNRSRLLFITLLVLFTTLASRGIAYAQSGCCSHHGGVCGCSAGGSKLCCDGTLSPSCTCVPPTTKQNIPPITKDRIDTTLNTLVGKTWCGAGDLFSTESAANKSLSDYKAKIEKPLQDQIGVLKSKLWGAIALGVVVFVAAMNRGKKWSDGLLGLILVFLFMGGFLLFIP